MRRQEKTNKEKFEFPAFFCFNSHSTSSPKNRFNLNFNSQFCVEMGSGASSNELLQTHKASNSKEPSLLNSNVKNKGNGSTIQLKEGIDSLPPLEIPTGPLLSFDRDMLVFPFEISCLDCLGRLGSIEPQVGRWIEILFQYCRLFESFFKT